MSDVKKLVEQIGGRERLEEIAADGFLKHGESKLMARTLLSVLDAKPVGEFYKYDPGDWYHRSPGDRGVKEWTPLYKVQPAPSAPDGWKLVPVEPTAKMMVAGTLVSEFQEDPAGMYRAMIAAAPSPGGDGG